MAPEPQRPARPSAHEESEAPEDGQRDDLPARTAEDLLGHLLSEPKLEHLYRRLTERS